MVSVACINCPYQVGMGKRLRTTFVFSETLEAILVQHPKLRYKRH